MKNLNTPEEIKKFQEVEPYPDWDVEYKKYLNRLDNHKLRIMENDFWEGIHSKDLLPHYDYDFDKYVQSRAKGYADWRVRNGTTLSWGKTRKLVWIRDNGICDVCGRELEFDEYECGHIVEYVAGGTNRLENLTVMCGRCNRYLKPLHETKEEYYLWIEKIRLIKTYLT